MCHPKMYRCWRLKYGCESIAFTYNEPTIWGEYIIDICKRRERSSESKP